MPKIGPTSNKGHNFPRQGRPTTSKVDVQPRKNAQCRGIGAVAKRNYVPSVATDAANRNKANTF